MDVKQLSSRTQWIMLGIIFLIIFSAYVYLRLVPQSSAVTNLAQQLEIDQNLLKKPNIPEEPAEDSAYLSKKLENLKNELSSIAGQAANLEQRLAPLDSQDVLLKISQLARTSRVKMVQNLPYLVQRRVKVEVNEGKVSNKKLSTAERKKLARKMRKKAKKARKEATKFGGVVGALTREGELMDKLVNDFEEARPLQEVVVEGGFGDLKTFIQGIQALPWQVTIVKLEIETIQFQKVPQGLPQPLKAKMIIGM